MTEHDLSWEASVARRHAEDPELKAAFDELEPAYLVARELVRARSEEKISQSELARRMGTTQSVISRLERMEVAPNLRTLEAIARGLGRNLEVRFVKPGSRVDVQEPRPLPDFMFGTSEEFVEGFSRVLAEQAAAAQDLLRSYVHDYALGHTLGRWVREERREGPADQVDTEPEESAVGE